MRYLAPFFIFFSQFASAEYFSHLDWEIACDNTLTCRAAGYNEEADELLVSVLLIRKAGEHPIEPVVVRLVDEEMGDEFPPNFSLDLIINNKNYGGVLRDSHSDELVLSLEQTNALVKSLLKTSTIIFEDHKNKMKWHLSDKGATAVLLKMDDIQGRIDTDTAIVKKGNESHQKLKKSLAIPVIKVPSIAPTSEADKALFASHQPEIFKAIKKLTPKDSDNAYCDGLYDDYLSGEVSIQRLTDTKILVSSACWMAAYNMGYGYWILNDKPPYSPQLITDSASEYSNGELSSSHKGRGVGDCWYFEASVWNGKTFIHSNEGSSGMCRGFPGGAWTLPTYVSRLEHEKKNSPK